MRVLIAALAAAPATALAHVPRIAGELHWEAEPWVIGLLALSATAYAFGLRRLWHHAGRGAGITRAEAAAFWTGWLLLVLALCSPLDGLAAELFSAHMVQHEILMVAAAPLLVLGRPLATWAWALPPSARTTVGRWTRGPFVRGPWQTIIHPLGAFLVHGVALWIWHVPALFSAALANEGIHALQHASFLFTALLFWWTVWGRAGTRWRDGPAVLSLFATMLHTGALGALLTLSPAPWYRSDALLASTWGLTALEDQHLGGLIMWIPAGTVYVAVALYLMARWLAASAAGAADSAA